MRAASSTCAIALCGTNANSNAHARALYANLFPGPQNFPSPRIRMLTIFHHLNTIDPDVRNTDWVLMRRIECCRVAHACRIERHEICKCACLDHTATAELHAARWHQRHFVNRSLQRHDLPLTYVVTEDTRKCAI